MGVILTTETTWEPILQANSIETGTENPDLGRSQMAELMTAGEGSSSQLTRLTKVVKFVRLLRQSFFYGKKTEKKHTHLPFFIGSMGLVYLPTWMVDFYGFHVGKYAIDGSVMGLKEVEVDAWIG